MLKRALLPLALASVLEAGMVAGLRYGQVSQNGELSGVASQKEEALGAGAIVGYDGGNFRVVLTHDDPGFEKPAQASITALGVHLIDYEDPDIRGFLGLGAGQMSYRHSAQSASDSAIEVDLYGIEVGLILLDDRFKGMQMELGYRYFKTYGDQPAGLELTTVSHAYVGLSVDLF